MIRNLLWVAFASVCLFLAVLGVSATEIVFGFGLFAVNWWFPGRDFGLHHKSQVTAEWKRRQDAP